MGGGLQKGCKCHCPGDLSNDMDPQVPTYPGHTSYVTRNALDGGGQQMNQDRGKGGILCMDRWCCPEATAGQVVGPMQQPSLSLSMQEKLDYDLQKGQQPISYPSQNQSQDALQAMLVSQQPVNGAVPAPVPALEFGQGNGVPPPPINSDRDGKTASEWADDQSQFAHLPPLPPGWLRILSRSTGKIYYCYPETGETTFQEPTGPPPSVAANQGLPQGWTMMVSRSTGRTYYWHAELQKSQFEIPTAADSVAGGPSPAAVAAPPAAASLPPNWVEMQSRSTGRTYFYHTQTQVSQFDRPTA